MATTQCEFKAPARSIRKEEGMQKWLDSEVRISISIKRKAIEYSVVKGLCRTSRLDQGPR